MALNRAKLIDFATSAGMSEYEKDDGTTEHISDMTTTEIAGSLGWHTLMAAAGLACASYNPITLAVTGTKIVKSIVTQPQYLSNVASDIVAMGFSTTSEGQETLAEHNANLFKKFLADTDNLITQNVLYKSSAGGGGHAFEADGDKSINWSFDRPLFDRVKKIGEWLNNGFSSWVIGTQYTLDLSSYQNFLTSLQKVDTHLTCDESVYNRIATYSYCHMFKVGAWETEGYCLIATEYEVDDWDFTMSGSFSFPRINFRLKMSNGNYCGGLLCRGGSNGNMYGTTAYALNTTKAYAGTSSDPINIYTDISTHYSRPNDYSQRSAEEQQEIRDNWKSHVIAANYVMNSIGGYAKPVLPATNIKNIYNTYNVITPGSTTGNPTSVDLIFNTTPTDYELILRDLGNETTGSTINITNNTGDTIYTVDTDPNTQTPVISDPTLTIADAINDLRDLVEKVGTAVSPNPSDNESDLAQVDVTDIGLTIYVLTAQKLSDLFTYLWTHTDIVDFLNKFLASPLNSIVSLSVCPFTPEVDAGSGDYIKFGGSLFPTNIQAHTVKKWIQKISLGSMLIPSRYGNFLDYSPYTKIRCYLPFIGIIELNADDVMSRTLELSYRIEFYTGTVLATIWVYGGEVNAEMYQYSGNCFMRLPISSADYSAYYKAGLTALSGFVGSIPSAATAAATGSVSGVLGSFAIGQKDTLLQLGNAKTSVNRTGQLQGNSAVMCGLTPYVIIERPIADETGSSNSYQSLNGKVACEHCEIRSLIGYAEVESVNVNNLPCTMNEKKELLAILQSGFYLGDSPAIYPN